MFPFRKKAILLCVFVLSSFLAQSQIVSATRLDSAITALKTSVNKFTYYGPSKTTVDSMIDVWRLQALALTFRTSPVLKSSAPVVYQSKSNFTIRGLRIDGGTSNCIYLNSCSNVHITGCDLRKSTNAGGVIYLYNCSNITVDSNYVANGIRGIYAFNCGAGIVIKRNNITTMEDLNEVHGGGSFIQFNQVNGAGCHVDSNKCYNAVMLPWGGDGIDIFKSNGTVSSPITIVGNSVRGGSLDPNGKDGIGVGDAGGSYQVCQYNVLVNTGYAGIQIAGGHDIDVSYNKIYCVGTPIALLGLSIYATGANITCGHNNINWRDYNLHVSNTKLAAGLAAPTGWSTNTAFAVADSLAYDGLLPNPLFTIRP